MIDRPVDPLPPVLLGGTINLLAGSPGVGKSTFLAWLTRQVHTRTPLWGHSWSPIPFQGIIAADRSWAHSTSRWFALEGMSDLPAYSLQDDREFKKARLRHKDQRLAIFEECLQKLSPNGDGKYPPGSIVYVDPLTPFLGGQLMDYDACMVACMEIRELLMNAGGVTVIGTAHASKQKADKQSRYARLQDRIIGSTALLGFTDTQMYLASPEETDRQEHVFLWAPHHAPTAMFEVRRDTDGTFQPGDCVETGEQTIQREAAQVKELKAKNFSQTTTTPTPDWLDHAFDTGPKTLAELIALASDHNCSRMTLIRHINKLELEGAIFRPKRGLYERRKQ